MTSAAVERDPIVNPTTLLMPTRYAFAPLVAFAAPVATLLATPVQWRGLRDEFEEESESEGSL